MGGSGTGGTTGGTTGTGGSGTGGGGSGMIPPDDACVATVMTSSCVACHSTAAAPIIGANLVLEGSDLGARLSKTTATYKDVNMNPASCVAGALIIDPGSPEKSILLKKVSGMQACGDKMPPGAGLSGDNLKCIQDWIAKF